MKTLGLIGGTSWVSTADYYRIINQLVNERLGGLNSAKLFLYSLNLEEFKPSADPGKLLEMESTLSAIALKLQTAGADCIMLCANTPHIVADSVESKISIPLIHIAEVTAREIKKQKLNKIGLLGTRVTMEENFYRDKLSTHQIETIIPDAEDIEFIHTSIVTELGKGIFTEETKHKYLVIIEKLVRQGAEGIILGCTEIPMLINPAECSIPLFDTTAIHATTAVKFALDM